MDKSTWSLIQTRYSQSSIKESAYNWSAIRTRPCFLHPWPMDTIRREGSTGIRGTPKPTDDLISPLPKTLEGSASILDSRWDRHLLLWSDAQQETKKTHGIQNCPCYKADMALYLCTQAHTQIRPGLHQKDWLRLNTPAIYNKISILALEFSSMHICQYIKIIWPGSKWNQYHVTTSMNNIIIQQGCKALYQPISTCMEPICI